LCRRPEFDTLPPFSLFHFFISPAALHSTGCHAAHSVVVPNLKNKFLLV